MNVQAINQHAKSLIEATWKDSSLWHQHFHKAKNLLETALATHPDDETTLINYGTVLCDMGNHQAAVYYLKKAISLGSNNQHAFYNLSVALINCNSHEDEKRLMQKAKSKQPSVLTWAAYFDLMAH